MQATVADRDGWMDEWRIGSSSIDRKSNCILTNAIMGIFPVALEYFFTPTTDGNWLDSCRLVRTGKKWLQFCHIKNSLQNGGYLCISGGLQLHAGSIFTGVWINHVRIPRRIADRSCPQLLTAISDTDAIIKSGFFRIENRLLERFENNLS